MRIGALSHRLSLQKQGGRDAAGQPTQAWTEVVKVWGDIHFVSGSQAVRAQLATDTAKVSVQIRMRDGVSAGMRMVGSDGTIYLIRDVLPDKRARDRINLPCEVVNG